MSDLKRTVCDCDVCQAGCRTMPGYLVPEDLPFFDVKDLRRSEGATVVVRGRLLDIPTLVPTQKENGECVFYQNGKCSVHEHAPYGCRMFSTCSSHLDPQDQQKRYHGIELCLTDMNQNGEYSRLAQTIEKALPRTERLMAYRILVDWLESLEDAHGY